MKEARIKGPDFEQVISLPETLSEVRLNNYVAFLSEAQKPGNAQKQIALAVAEFYGIDEATVFNLGTGDVNALFKYAVNVVSKFAPTHKKETDCTFMYNDQYFTIPRILPPILAGGEEIPPVIQIADAIEIQETIRLNEAETKRMFDKYQDGDGKLKDIAPEDVEAVGKAFDRRRDLSYSQYLRLIAILTRSNKEPLPVSDFERENWITQRAIFFKDIDAATALDIDFFLQSTLSVCKKPLQISGILFNQTFALLAAMQPQSKRKQQRTKGQFHTGKRYSSGRGSGRLSRALLNRGGLKAKK